jgi:hypothetical protein
VGPTVLSQVSQKKRDMGTPALLHQALEGGAGVG